MVQPAQGNPVGPRSQSGTVETNTFAMVATYNVLAGPVTPFIDANLGGTYVHTDIADAPPSLAASGILGMGISVGLLNRPSQVHFSVMESEEACDGT